MKQSGIDWIGEIPDDWNVNKIDSLYILRNTKVSDKDYPPLSVTMQGIVPQLATAAKSDDGDNRKLVKKGDFAINSRSDRRGSSGVSAYDGSVSLINTILTPRGEMNPIYYNWLFHTIQFEDEFYKWGHGIVDDLWTTRWQDMKNIFIVVPPKATQERIAEYLDSKCAQIDSIIEESKKSIEEYKAWKQSVIFEAVTGKLKNEKFSDKWELIKIKYVAEYNTKTLPENTKDEFNFNYIDIGSVKFGEGITNFQNMIFKDAPSRARRIVKKDDVIISSVRTYLRAIARIEESEIPQIASTGFVVFSSKPQKILPRFLFYAISSESFVGKVEANSVGISYPAINASQIANFKIPLPPLSEQESIAKMLDSKCAQIDSLIAEKESLIADLTEYKKSLIFEVVTGKRSV